MTRLLSLALLVTSFLLAASGCCIPIPTSGPSSPPPSLTPTPTPTVSGTPAPPSAPAPVAAPSGEAAPESFGVAECDDYARRACSCSNAMIRPSLCQAARQSFDTWRTVTHPAARAGLAQGCAQAAQALAQSCP